QRPGWPWGLGRSLALPTSLAPQLDCGRRGHRLRHIPHSARRHHRRQQRCGRPLATIRKSVSRSAAAPRLKKWGAPVLLSANVGASSEQGRELLVLRVVAGCRLFLQADHLAKKKVNFLSRSPRSPYGKARGVRGKAPRGSPVTFATAGKKGCLR